MTTFGKIYYDRCNTNGEKKQQELVQLKNKYSNEFPGVLIDYLEQMCKSAGFSPSEIDDCYDDDFDEWVADLFELANC